MRGSASSHPATVALTSPEVRQVDLDREGHGGLDHPGEHLAVPVLPACRVEHIGVHHRDACRDQLAPLGVTGEGFERYRLVALDVPPYADIAAVKRLLHDGTRDGWWEYEEGCISDVWQAAGPDQDVKRCRPMNGHWVNCH